MTGPNTEHVDNTCIVSRIFLPAILFVLAQHT